MRQRLPKGGLPSLRYWGTDLTQVAPCRGSARRRLAGVKTRQLCPAIGEVLRRREASPTITKGRVKGPPGRDDP